MKVSQFSRPGVLRGYALCEDGYYRKPVERKPGITGRVEVIVRNTRGQLVRVE